MVHCVHLHYDSSATFQQMFYSGTLHGGSSWLSIGF